MAIGVSISHKIADAYTLGKLVNTWAALTRGSSEAAVSPEFGCAASFLPPPKDFSSTMPAMKFKHEKAIVRRIVFYPPKISMLKARATSATVPQPTRVEVVAVLFMENWNDFVAIAIGVASSCQLAQTTEPSVTGQRRRLSCVLVHRKVTGK
ncbi:hypothetical protein V6N13_108097 [Hibiscus sabdariffa]|uniref:Uncharacterized protein n=1 Tax=Hibiscus sabdariffa TaxID=183260 RepID=A0ABR2SR67_9ROSI